MRLIYYDYLITAIFMLESVQLQQNSFFLIVPIFAEYFCIAALTDKANAQKALHCLTLLDNNSIVMYNYPYKN